MRYNFKDLFLHDRFIDHVKYGACGTMGEDQESQFYFNYNLLIIRIKQFEYFKIFTQFTKWLNFNNFIFGLAIFFAYNFIIIIFLELIIYITIITYFCDSQNMI